MKTEGLQLLAACAVAKTLTNHFGYELTEREIQNLMDQPLDYFIPARVLPAPLDESEREQILKEATKLALDCATDDELSSPQISKLPQLVTESLDIEIKNANERRDDEETRD